jgi:hypothetical protein
MKLSKETKSILWSILEKYDNHSDYIEFCDALSNLIQGKSDSKNFIVIYTNLLKIDSDDKSMIDYSIGNSMDSVLFSI